jgi:DNA-binding NtrC family response regulator
MTENNDIDLDDAILGQRDISKIRGKLVVLAINQQDERQAFANLLTDMELQVKHAVSTSEVMELLEDHPAHLLVMDMQLPDIHAWKMISKVREINHLRDLPIMVITNQGDFGMTVAKVDYLTRPVSIARLRQNVWSALNQQNDLEAD